ncbi:hypothetical protein BDB00DRAFT_127944 [Zychaea mexicana]|uniref:uncharacterized protein n=1 Tax=Zychaea mexicana TaxID=64656 RepID=UPI0022FE54EC|nr:uncharacterized protein BDB00DRAFT_127944 [Zychaea mexicana]KAI9484587.1 hypothetical protein BDB00DRAFT_127944 [Zychaea mexicana]
MAVAKVFDIVWDKSEGIKSDYPLHASLILETIGSTFMILALFRLLQVWQQVGLRGGGSGTRVLSLLAPITTFLVMVICIAGDIFLIKQDLVEEDGGEEDVEKTHTALLIKFVGALLFVVLTLVYMGLVMYLAHATKRCGTGIAAAASSAATTYLSNVRSNPSLLIPVLATLGILTLIRFSYYMALVGNMAFSQDDLDDEETLSWPLYVGLIVVPEIGAIIVAFLYDLTQVKNGVEVSCFWTRIAQDMKTLAYVMPYLSSTFYSLFRVISATATRFYLLGPRNSLVIISSCLRHSFS